ncbi:MAG: lipopolysaccharide biosynthesis protein RfbH [Lachnospiraceae bacterium]|nr:lipopolysaccharide biosynthesis protein RfbH [Lachnospiraceae bacterium]
MFEGLSEAEARALLVRLSGDYCEKYHKRREYEAGDHISYGGRFYDRDDMEHLVDASLEFWLTAGHYTREFEEKFARYLGVKHCSVVNSGSSANLLAFMALTSPLLGERAIRPGDEVITVACGFPTTVSPVLQYGAVPVFLDVTIPQYNIDVTELEAAYSEGKTKAVMIAHTLGNPFDLAAVKAFCDRHGLWLIEDNCDALGSEYLLDGVSVKTGTAGDIGTSSFYPPHHMTMGEGGAVYTDDPLLHRIVRSLRDWGRDCVCESGQDNRCGHRYDGQFGLLPAGYDHKYVYSHLGYNLKATDLQASVGVAQLAKLDSFTASRREHHAVLFDGLRDLEDKLILPVPCENSKPSWFGFMICCREGVDRTGLVRFLEGKGIQTRMLFSGNLTRHPCFDAIREEEGSRYRIVGKLANTDRIMRDGFWIGVYPGMTEKMLDVMIEEIHAGVKML